MVVAFLLSLPLPLPVSLLLFFLVYALAVGIDRAAGYEAVVDALGVVGDHLVDFDPDVPDSLGGLFGRVVLEESSHSHGW